MTIGTATARVSFNCNGATSVFPVPIQSYLASDFLVLATNTTAAALNGIGAGATVTLVLNGDYTMAPSSTDAPPKWTLTTPAVFYLTGITLQVILNTAEVQQTQYVQNQQFPSLAVQTNMDRVTQMAIRLSDQVSRTIHQPDGDVTVLNPLPTAAARASTLLGFDANGQLTIAPSLATVLTQAAFNLFLAASAPYVATPAEGNLVGVTINTTYPYGSLARYGILPGNSAGTNGAALQAFLAASVANGPTGQFYLPNTTGADVYAFDLRFYPIRDGIHIDLQNCTVNFATGTPTAGKPILMWIRDFRLENGTINMSGYTGTSGLMRGGSRYNDGIGWAGYPNGIRDQDDLLASSLPLQGNYILKNLRISSSNSGQTTIVLIGGLRNVLLENLFIDGASTAPAAIYYEWGVASDTINGGVPANSWTWTTSHAADMIWRNIRATNHATGASNFALSANGAHNLVVEDCDLNTCGYGLQFGSGEAFYYRPWAQDGLTGSPRLITMRNILVQGATQYGISCVGAQACAPGTLMYNAINALGATAKSQATTDYLNFVIEGAKIYGDGGVIASGRNVVLRDVQVIGAGVASSGGIFVPADTLHITIERADVRGVNGTGIRHNIASTLWAATRPRFATIRDSIIAGCTNTAIGLDYMESAVIENNQIGYNTIFGDTANESVMSTGVSVGTNQTANAVVCRSNYMTVTGNQYSNISGLGQVAENERNPTLTTSGVWITQLPAATQTGYGTPTGAVLTTNFPGATATLVQTSEMVAQLINLLKSNGIAGA